MRKHLSLILLAVCAAIQAQTARKFTIALSEGYQSVMTAYLPETSSGRAIVGIPGGGYSMLSNSHEGHQWSEWLNAQGIAYFVVDYRMPKGDRTLPISDVENTFRIVRDSAAVWSLNPRDVGIMGFSAGGHLASVISTLSPYEVRPDFSILFYPVISMDETKSHRFSCENFLGQEGHHDPALVSKYSTDQAVRRHLTPPAIVITSSDDQVVPPLTNALAYYTAMRRAGNDCTLHVYPTGGHGYGFGTFFSLHDQLLTDLGTWLKNLKAPHPDALHVACVGNSITAGHTFDLNTQTYPAQLQQRLGEGYWVRNFGVNGCTLLHEGDFPYTHEQAWTDAQAFRPDIVILKLGTNDSKPQNWQHASDFRKNLEEMLTTLSPSLAQTGKNTRKAKKDTSTTGKKPLIVLCTPLPAFKSSWGISEEVISGVIIPIIQDVATQYNLNVIDFHTLFDGQANLLLDDGIHPNQRGAARIAEIVAEKVKEITQNRP